MRKARRLEPPSFSNSNSIGATIRAKYIVINGISIDKDYANFVPQKYNRLTAIGPKFMLNESNGNRRAHQVCVCECGSVGVYVTSNIELNRSRSCGCYLSDWLVDTFTKHGDARSTEHMTWQGMKSRCSNPKNNSYPNYGGRGIKVCDRWLEPDGRGYMNFLEDMGRRPSTKHSIDRIDVNGDYCPENCRWATDAEQAKNKRNTTYITGFGETKDLYSWAECYSIHPETLRDRINAGMSLEEAVSHPKGKNYPKRPKDKSE